MSDIVMLAVTTAFFALCLGYVRWCDDIIGPDPSEPFGAGAEDLADDGAPERTGGRA